jgi:hypothetical protein
MIVLPKHFMIDRDNIPIYYDYVKNKLAILLPKSESFVYDIMVDVLMDSGELKNLNDDLLISYTIDAYDFKIDLLLKDCTIHETYKINNLLYYKILCKGYKQLKKEERRALLIKNLLID